MSSDFPHYNFRMPNIGFQNLPLNIYIVVFGTAIFVFILSLLFCCYLIRLRHQAHKEFYAYKQVILKEKVKELNLHELCAVCLEDFKPRDELGICPCKHAFHRKWVSVWNYLRGPVFEAYGATCGLGTVPDKLDSFRIGLQCRKRNVPHRVRGCVCVHTWH